MRTNIFALINTVINSWDIPALSYSFGGIKWNKTYLEELDRLFWRMLIKFRVHHPNSALECFYLPQKQGGRVLRNISHPCQSQIENLTRHFDGSRNDLLQQIWRMHKAASLLRLNEELIYLREHFIFDLVQNWKDKPFTADILNNFMKLIMIDHCSSWRRGIFTLKLMELIIVVCTKNYERHVLNQCRKCDPDVTIVL